MVNKEQHTKQELIDINKELNKTCDDLDEFNDNLVKENKRLEEELELNKKALSIATSRLQYYSLEVLTSEEWQKKILLEAKNQLKK